MWACLAPHILSRKKNFSYMTRTEDGWCYYNSCIAANLPSHIYISLHILAPTHILFSSFIHPCRAQFGHSHSCVGAHLICFLAQLHQLTRMEEMYQTNIDVVLYEWDASRNYGLLQESVIVIVTPRILRECARILLTAHNLILSRAACSRPHLSHSALAPPFSPSSS